MRRWSQVLKSNFVSLSPGSWDCKDTAAMALAKQQRDGFLLEYPNTVYSGAQTEIVQGPRGCRIGM